MLGMAVGTGNIWRFPRIAATYDGGSFLVAWIIFLFIWSIPLILVEFAMGKATRCGAVGAFAQMMGRGYGWMGAWVAWTATAIMFYYAVVTGWTIRFALAALTGELGRGEPGGLWASFAYTPRVIVYQGLAMGLGVLIVARGVTGIERAARILMPSLFVLLLVLAVRAVTLPGASNGLAFLFTPSWQGLTDHRVWLAALTQNAWDTGAGWGLILTYAIYLRQRDDTTLNAVLLGVGNNTVSLIAGVMVLCTIFALMPHAREQIVGAGNEDLTFVWVPQLFARMTAGRLFMIVFFLALFFAAMTSLISMIELATRVLQDGGVARARALATVGTAGFVLGIPSALSREVFLNQDWVWGIGLMVSGLFFACAVLRHGVGRFRATFINTEQAEIRIGAWWEWAMRFVVVQAAVLVLWWFYQVRAEPAWGAYGIANSLLQWSLALAVFLGLNAWMVRRTRPDVARDRSGAPEA